MKKIVLLFVLFIVGSQLYAQTALPANIEIALKADDAVTIDKLVTKDNINACYGNYSILSDAIRLKAGKCFSLLLTKGADVNKSCNGYIPPLMHAIKYGNLEMVKALIAKGADKNYTYNGELKLTNGPEKGDTPLIYADKYGQDEIADYLNSLK
ncbi:ankyrin repeat domain-containing protein [Mucilaginibacter pocheonensis]|uniref:Ankyrin repeat protein n=1 Tax=Mucilaginibacter pocheonensis TaxID=398050 RepID=A0ABU1T7J2_9SPHI|nr:ankyrin repeat domain-containing protein [Mucilaginibacter pocheonensis]MDR6941365.1 ankyrin repeat protein [Mucilaginibacter pocheonensis]